MGSQFCTLQNSFAGYLRPGDFRVELNNSVKMCPFTICDAVSQCKRNCTGLS